MNYVLWLMYAADVVVSIGVACVMLITVFAIWLGVVCAIQSLEEHKVTWSVAKTPAMLLAFACAVGILTPGKTTLYAIAAAHVGEQVAATEEFELLRQILKKELRKIVEKK